MSIHPNHGQSFQTPEEGLPFDQTPFDCLLDDKGLTESQKLQFLECLWYIIVSFVDLGFGVHPVDHCNESQDSKSSSSPNFNSDSGEE